METQDITRASFTAAMEAAVAERGADYVYTYTKNIFNRCEYTEEDGAPGCIIGLALAKLGYTGENTRTLAYGCGLGAVQALLRLGVHDERLRAAAELAQRAQDGGEDWGAALATYHRVLAYG